MGYDRGAMGKRRKLTDAERAANVAAGLTPTGRVKVINNAAAAPIGRRPPNGGRGTYSPGDYRCTGRPFTPARKNHYCRIVRETGEEPLARAETGVSRWTVDAHKAKDPAFRDAIDEAYRQHASIYAREMKRRGVDGVQEPVFGSQGPQMGTGIVGWITRYSDRLLIEQARRFNKEYTPKQEVTSTNTTTVKSSPSLGLEGLSPESREDLRRILEREAARAPEVEPEEGA